MAEESKKTGPGKSLIIIVLALLIAAVLLFAALHSRKAPLAPEQKGGPEPAGRIEAPVAEPQSPEVLEAKKSPPPPAPAEPAKRAATQCELTIGAMNAFFDRLDKQGYVEAYQLKQGTKHHMSGLLKKLFANQPTIVRETDNLFSILNNMTHFFRVLGKWDIVLAKELMAREENNLEELLALFYQWSEISDQCDQPENTISLPLAGLYEYAGFFLNTMGGQSYLFRRESKTRMLIKYYAVLVLDRANDRKINKYGLDIRPPLDSLLREMETSPDLKRQATYLETLEDLQEKYQTRYGDQQ